MFEENVKTAKYSEEDAAYLISVVDNTEADRISAALNDARIPVLRKYEEAGSAITVIMGDSVFGIDLYVPTELLDKAKDIVAVVNGDMIPDVDVDQPDEEISREDELQAGNSSSRLVCKTIFGVFFISDLVIYAIAAAILICVLIITLTKML